ncbi:RidA family protein [Pseudaestuariivita sp.]|uniref:RidA family protein n=1 Tax=Pseudaestuariivita sp. TaxID=2211669 RepID=UPI0040598E4C
MVDVTAKLAEMGLELPSASAPAANYIPFVQTGSTLYVSGQISLAADGSKIVGKVGDTLTPEEGAAAAERCGLNLLAQVGAAIGGDWSRFKRVVKLTGFVNSTPDFEGQPTVINGCSDLMVAVLGDAGRHARSAVSAGALPLGVAVEIEGIFEID